MAPVRAPEDPRTSTVRQLGYSSASGSRSTGGSGDMPQRVDTGSDDHRFAATSSLPQKQSAPSTLYAQHAKENAEVAIGQFHPNSTKGVHPHVGDEENSIGLAPMTEKEMEMLEKQTQTVEQQMEFLTNCVNRLSKELAAEQTTNQLLTSHVDDAFQRLRKGALRDSEDDTARHRIIDDAKLLHSHQWLEPQHPQVQHALLENEKLFRLLEEERLSRVELRAQYEKQLNLLRNVAMKRKGEERRKVLQEFDFVINKYHDLAREAARLARSERDKTKEEKLRVQKLAEVACKAFERDIKEKTKRALDEYRTLAQGAHDAAKRERAELIRHCSDLESSVDRERRAFESQEAERRVSGYREACEKINQEMLKDRTKYQESIDKLCDLVEGKCKEFERNLLGKTLQVLWEHGVDMEETELSEKLSAASGVPLRSTVIERSRREAELQRLVQSKKPPTDSNRYGLVPLNIRDIPEVVTTPKITVDSDNPPSP